jgi:hypothetical protein
MEHTKEPWELRTTLHGYFNEKCLSITQIGIGQLELAECIAIIDPIHLVGDLQKANARRIVACVNACAGISNEVLAGALHHGVDPLQKRIAKITADVLHAIEAFESCNYSASTDCHNAKRVREALATLLEIKAGQ